jgi:hypothetical protein
MQFCIITKSKKINYIKHSNDSKIADNSLTLFRHEIPGSHCAVHKDLSLPVCYVLLTGTELQTFRRGILLSTSG